MRLRLGTMLDSLQMRLVLAISKCLDYRNGPKKLEILV